MSHATRASARPLALPAVIQFRPGVSVSVCEQPDRTLVISRPNEAAFARLKSFTDLPFVSHANGRVKSWWQPAFSGCNTEAQERGRYYWRAFAAVATKRPNTAAETLTEIVLAMRNGAGRVEAEAFLAEMLESLFAAESENRGS